MKIDLFIDLTILIVVASFYLHFSLFLYFCLYKKLTNNIFCIMNSETTVSKK